MREHSVIKCDAIGTHRCVWSKLRKFGDERIAYLIVCIEAKDPIGGDLRLLNRVAPLACMRIEAAREHSHIGELRKNRKRAVGTSAVDNNNVFGPGKPRK